MGQTGQENEELRKAQIRLRRIQHYGQVTYNVRSLGAPGRREVGRRFAPMVLDPRGPCQAHADRARGGAGVGAQRRPVRGSRDAAGRSAAADSATRPGGDEIRGEKSAGHGGDPARRARPERLSHPLGGEDLAHRDRVLDHDDHPHPSPTVRAGQHVERERAAHEGGPGPVAERGRGALPALGAAGNTRYPESGWSVSYMSVHVRRTSNPVGFPVFRIAGGPGRDVVAYCSLTHSPRRNRSQSGSARLGPTRANRPDSRPILTAGALWRRDGVRAENPGVGGSIPPLSTISYTYGPPHDPGVASWHAKVTDSRRGTPSSIQNLEVGFLDSRHSMKR